MYGLTWNVLVPFLRNPARDRGEGRKGNLSIHKKSIKYFTSPPPSNVFVVAIFCPLLPQPVAEWEKGVGRCRMPGKGPFRIQRISLFLRPLPPTTGEEEEEEGRLEKFFFVPFFPFFLRHLVPSSPKLVSWLLLQLACCS